MGIARNIARLIPNGSGLLPNANIEAVAASKLTGQVADANAPSGSVIQVVSATKTDTFSTTSTGFVDATGMSLSITPSSASNQILIMYTINVGFDVYRNVTVRLMRNSTAICIGDAASSRTRASNYTGQDLEGSYIHRSFWPLNNRFLDSPSTTSAITYKLQMGAINDTDGSTIYLNRTGGDTDDSIMARVASTITAMEIAA
jgi:hypothetical protein